jgi:hypothetical protein
LSLALYLLIAILLLFLWSRFVQRLSIAVSIALLLLPLLFTGRALFTNRILTPVDLMYEAPPLKGHGGDHGIDEPYNRALSDLQFQILPWQQVVRESIARGDWPLWNPHILCGDILAAAAQPAVYDPVQWIGMLLPLPDAFGFGVTLTLFLAALFTFAFARALSFSEPAALVSAAGFTFCGMLAFFVGWPLGRAWAYLPLVLFAVRQLTERATLQATVLLTTGFVLVIVAGHPESVLHIVFVGALYGAYETRRVKSIAMACIAGAIALLLTAVMLLPFAEAVTQTLESSIRTELYATASYEQLARPEVRQQRMLRTFVGDDGGSDPLSARVGPVILFLAVVGIVAGRRDRAAWFFAGLALVCMLATFGSWPVAHLLHAIPLFDIAINERLAFAAAFSLAILAGFGVNAIRRRELAIGFLLLVLVQRTAEEGRLYPVLSRDAFFPPVPLFTQMEPGARIVGLGFALPPNIAGMYGLQDARGYEAMTFRRLADTYPLWSVFQTAWFNRVDDLSRPFLSYLNVRYAISEWDAPEGWRVIAQDRGTRLLENERVLPRAFVPASIRFHKDPKVILDEMTRAANFHETAWIEMSSYPPQYAPNGPGRLTVRRRRADFEIDAVMENAGWVVISETAWKGWRAYIDGNRVATHYANHAFLGVHVPAGTHRLRLTYYPESFVLGRTISVTTLVLCIVSGIWLAWRRRPRNHAHAEG